MLSWATTAARTATPTPIQRKRYPIVLLTRACVDITPAAADAVMAVNCQAAYVLYGCCTELGKPLGSTSASIASAAWKALA